MCIDELLLGRAFRISISGLANRCYRARAYAAKCDAALNCGIGNAIAVTCVCRISRKRKTKVVSHRGTRLLSLIDPKPPGASRWHFNSKMKLYRESHHSCVFTRKPEKKKQRDVTFLSKLSPRANVRFEIFFLFLAVRLFFRNACKSLRFRAVDKKRKIVCVLSDHL